MRYSMLEIRVSERNCLQGSSTMIDCSSSNFYKHIYIHWIKIEKKILLITLLGYTASIFNISVLHICSTHGMTFYAYKSKDLSSIHVFFKGIHLGLMVNSNYPFHLSYLSSNLGLITLMFPFPFLCFCIPHFIDKRNNLS